MPEAAHRYGRTLQPEGREEVYLDNWYTRWCRRTNAWFPSLSKSVKRSREIGRKKEFEAAEKRFHAVEAEFEAAQKKYRTDDPRYRTMENKYKRAVDQYEKKKREYERDDFRRALKFARFDLEPHEVITFGYVVLIIAAIGMLIESVFLSVSFIPLDMDKDGYVDLDKNSDGINDIIEDVNPDYTYVKDEHNRDVRVLVGYYGEISIVKFMLLIIVPFLVVVFGLYTFIVSYPESYARRLRVQTLGTMPEAINYMVMSMHLTPSLDRAVDFAANNVSEPMASNLKKILWDVYMREYDSIEDALVAFAYDWGEWNEDFKRSIYAVRSAVLERSVEGLHRTLQRGNEVMLEGTKRQIEAYAASLAAPTMTLFALGVLLPITLSAILPIAQISIEQLFYVALALDVLFPLVTFMYAYHIMGMRPGTSVPPKVPSPITEMEKNTIMVICILMAVGFFILGYFTFTSALSVHTAGENEHVSDFQHTISLLGSMPFMWGIAFPLSFYLFMMTRDQKKVRDLTLQMEREFPDALFQLGSRIAERKPIEDAMRKVGESMKGTMIAWTFRKISFSLQVTRSSLKKVLFGREGIFKDFPSTTIKASMRTVLDAVKKDPVTAGQTIIGISSYLRDLKDVEHDIRVKLGQTINMMMATATYFAPMIMGIVSSIYILLSKYLGGVNIWGTTGEQAAKPIPGDIFSLVIEIYLILTIGVIIFFCAGIQYGEDNIERKHMLSRTLPVATIIYTVSAVVAKIYIGGY